MASLTTELTLELGIRVTKGKDWLQSAYLRTHSGGAGWSHFLGEDEPTVWGGTLDGIRAMLYLGMPPLSTDLSDAVAWLKKQQRQDGGFGSREMEYSAAEATAWVIITLAQLGLDSGNDTTVKAAVAYLMKCIDPHGGVSTSPHDFDQPRTFPSTLALWALATQPHAATTCNLIIERLRATQDQQTGGWGQRFGAQPNPITTAQVLNALVIAGVSTDTVWVRKAAKYVVDGQEASGAWPNSHDEWFTKLTPRIPYRTSHLGTTWALLALHAFEDRAFRQAATRGIRYLLDRQRPNGAWIYEEYDPTEQVWCTTQVLIVLTMWRSRLPTASVGTVSQRVQSVGVKAADALAGVLGWLRASIVYIAVALVLIVQFRQGIVGFSKSVLAFLHVDSAGVWTNLLSSAIWGLLIVAGSLILRRISRRDDR